MSTSSTNPDHVIKTPTSPVIIIGAGVAGLSAAKRLKENNIPVLILEGRNRLGGRIHTVAMDTQDNNKNSNQEEGSTQKKAFVDMGAAWMDGGPQFNSLCRFAQDHGLTLVHTPYQENPAEIGRQHRAWDAKRHKWLNWFQVNWLMFRNGMILRALEQQENKAQYQNMYQRVQQIYRQPGLLNLGKDHYDQMLAETFTVHNEAAFLTEIHPLNDDVAYFHVKDEYHKGTEYMIQGGYHKLIELLQEGIGEEEILLNHTVTSIADRNSNNGVTVTTTQSTTNDNGITKTTFQGSHVIVTVPLGVLKANNLLLFEPPLPPSKQGAIQRIGFGVLEKIAMTFPTTFWRTVPHRRQDVYHIGVEHPVDFPNFVDVTESAGAPTLVTTTVAKAQLVHDNPQEAVERVQSLLASMFGKLYQEPLDIQTTRWKTDPFSLGAYMHFGREMKPGDIELLAEPYGRIRFAGEATSTEYPSYVEGAALSGQREADRILAELRIS